MKVVIINGSGGVGKDTFIEYFSNYAKRVSSFSTIDLPVKLAKEFFGWNGIKNETSRKLLSDIKDFLTNKGDVPYKYCLKKVKELSSYSEYIFINSREPEEIQRLVTAFNAATLLITSSLVAPIVSNHADKNVSNYKYDFYISNDSTLEELDDKARQFFLALQSY